MVFLKFFFDFIKNYLYIIKENLYNIIEKVDTEELFKEAQRNAVQEVF